MVLDRVGLTGSTGMVGRHIKALLEQSGINVVPVSRSTPTHNWNLSEWLTHASFDQVFSSVDAVVHAGAVLRVSEPTYHSYMFDVNVRSCVNLAEWAISRSIPLIYISSATVYAEPHARQLNEQSQTSLGELGGFYADSKLIAENIMSLYRQRGLQLAVLRPSSIYGYGGDTSKTIYRFLRLASRGDAINVKPPVDDCIDFVHASDVASAVLATLKTSAWQTFNIASGVLTSIHQLATTCIQTTGSGKICIDKISDKLSDSQITFDLDTSFARERLAWAPSVSLGKGIRMLLSEQILP